MFCEKCGNQVPDGSKFCEKCGNPIAQAPAPQAAQPVQQPVQQNYQQPQQPVQQNYQQPVQQSYQQPAQQPVQPPKAPRQPMSPGVKKAIIFGGIGVAVIVIALVALFAFIIPSLNKVDISKYLETKINTSDSTIYDGEISGKVSVSTDRLYIDKLGDAETKKLLENKNSITDYKDLIDSASKAVDSSTKRSALADITYDLELECKIKDAKEETTEDSESASSGSSYTAEFKNAKQSDVLEVTIKWPKDPIKIKEIEQYENIAGLTFDKSDKTVEIKLEDKIKENKVKVTEKVTVDFVKYINDNKLIKIKGLQGDYPSAYLKEFEFTEGDYTFTNKSEKKSSYSTGTEIKVTNKKDEDKKKSFYVHFDSLSDVSEGEDVTFTINSNTDHLYNTDVFFTSTEGTFKYVPNKPMTLDEAKKSTEKITQYLKDNITKIDSSITKAENFEIQEMYYIIKKDAEDDSEAVIYAFYKNTAKNKYKYISISKAYLADGDFMCGSAYDSWSSYSSVADSQKYLNPFYKSTKDDYNTTKIY